MNQDGVTLFKNVIELTLDDGTNIWTDQVHIINTYAGVVELQIFDEDAVIEINKMVLFESDYPERGLWLNHSDIPKIILNEEDYESRLNEILPRFKCTALFTSFRTTDSGNLESSLILHWLQDEPYPFLLEGNASLLKALDWRSVATEYET